MNNKQFSPEARKRIIIGFICTVIFLYIGQLFILQLVNNDYKSRADSNAFLKKILYPSRGTLYDRNDKLLVYNRPSYDVMVVMKETQAFDTLYLASILNVPKDYVNKQLNLIKNKKLNPGYSPYLPQVFFTQLGDKEYGVLQEALYKLPGFYVQNRTAREYAFPNAAHLLGYVAEIDKQGMKKDPYYIQGDRVGKTGVERSYEAFLRGEKGVEILLRDANGRIKGKYENGEYDQNPVSGKNLTLSIDIDLQSYGEELMQNKLGSIIMIEPSSGEILCMVAAPTYDPSILVGRQFVMNYQELVKNPYKPLINRALNGTYPPGSTFKPAQGLIFLEEGAIQPETMFSCQRGFLLGNRRLACHGHSSPLSLVPAIGTSCNSYFCWGLRAMLGNREKYSSNSEALDTWRSLLFSQGFGPKLGVDLPGEKSGIIPSSQYYNKIYKNRWNSITITSIAIGQGEVTATPIQMCNLAASIANRGYFYTPHAVKKIENSPLDTAYTNRKGTHIDPEHYKAVIDGMRLAVTNGTCRKAQIPDIEVCAKTGTAQNSGKDHSIFIAFAPKDNPKVALAIYVENGGFGADYAVPIGRLMIQKYLKGEVPESDKWLETTMKNAIILRSVLSQN